MGLLNIFKGQFIDVIEWPVVKELDNIKSDTTGQLEWKYNIYSNEELKATLSTVESLLNMSNTTIEEE